MRYRNAACALYVALLAFSASALGWAQTPTQASGPELEAVPPPSWAFNDLACAPALVPARREEGRTHRLRVSGDGIAGHGHQGLVRTRRYAGHQRRLECRPGNRAALFRPPARHRAPERLKPSPSTIHTAGWVQILGVDTTLATATVLHACDGILLDDYLEPFAPPMIAARSMPGTTPQYDNMGHIVTGAKGCTWPERGQVMTIDRGSNAGVLLGQRFLVFRDKRDQRVETTGRSKRFEEVAGTSPLVEIGEVLVVAVRPDDATVQVLGSQRRRHQRRPHRADSLAGS